MTFSDASAEYSDSHTTTVGGTTINNRTFILAKDVEEKNILTAASNIYGIAGTNIEVNLSTDQIRIEETGNDSASTKEIASIDESDTPSRWVIPLRMVGHIFTIRGFLSDGLSGSNITGTSPAESNTALNKKKVILAMQESGTTVRFYYRNEAARCFIRQAQFIDTNTESSSTDTVEEPFAKIEFIIQLWVGVDKG